MCSPSDYLAIWPLSAVVREELSFPVYRRVATMIFVPAKSGSASALLTTAQKTLGVTERAARPEPSNESLTTLVSVSGKQDFAGRRQRR
jgi:hypothetical protein